MKKHNIIGACIALVALVLLIFLPLVDMGEGIALFDCFKHDLTVFAIAWIVFPVLCIVANLVGKLRVLAAWLMLIPFAWGLCYLMLPVGGPGVGVWVYGALTVVLIIYSMVTKKKAKNQEI